MSRIGMYRRSVEERHRLYGRMKKCPICVARESVDSPLYWKEYMHILRSAPTSMWHECSLHNHFVHTHWSFCQWLSAMPACLVCSKTMSTSIRDSVESDCHMMHTHILRLREHEQKRHIHFLAPIFLLMTDKGDV